MSLMGYLPTASSALQLYPLLSLLCSDSWHGGSWRWGVMDPGWLLRAAVLTYVHRALSVRSSISGCCQGGGKKGRDQGQFPGRKGLWCQAPVIHLGKGFGGSQATRASRLRYKLCDGIW